MIFLCQPYIVLHIHTWRLAGDAGGRRQRIYETKRKRKYKGNVTREKRRTDAVLGTNARIQSTANQDVFRSGSLNSNGANYLLLFVPHLEKTRHYRSPSIFLSGLIWHYRDRNRTHVVFLPKTAFRFPVLILDCEKSSHNYFYRCIWFRTFLCMVSINNHCR